MTPEKKVNGRKRHILVDTNGLLLRVLVHPADITESEGAEWLLGQHQHSFPRLQTVRADQGYIRVARRVGQALYHSRDRNY